MIRRRGFSVIELTIAVSLLAIVLTIAWTLLSRTGQVTGIASSRLTTLQASLVLRSAVQRDVATATRFDAPGSSLDLTVRTPDSSASVRYQAGAEGEVVRVSAAGESVLGRVARGRLSASVEDGGHVIVDLVAVDSAGQSVRGAPVMGLRLATRPQQPSRLMYRRVLTDAP